MRIDGNETVGHLAARHPHVLRLFESWGVDYCCSGPRRVGELCSMMGITVGELALQVELSTLANNLLFPRACRAEKGVHQPALESAGESSKRR